MHKKVYLVFVDCGEISDFGEMELMKVFSSRELAEKWSDDHKPKDDCSSDNRIEEWQVDDA